MSSLFNYITKIFSSSKPKPFENIKIDTIASMSTEYPPYTIPNKPEKLHLLLQIRHIKNIYYKYTNSPSFRQDLYDSFSTDTDFDHGEVAFDDEDNIRIFDKYIINYIKERQEYVQGLRDKDNKVHFYLSTGHLEEHTPNEAYHILFIMDMTDKRIFEYCYNMYTVQSADFNIIKTLLSAIIYHNMNKSTKVFCSSYTPLDKI